MNYAGFDGFITKNGEIVSITNVDGMLAIVCGRTENQEAIVEMLWSLLGECISAGHYRAACDYLEKVLVLVDSPEEKAKHILAMGQALERAGEHRAALDVYLKGTELPLEPDLISYFLHNNLGHCLNQEGRFQEAESHCRAAIKINPARHNAHKNLGIALEGLGRFCDAARSFMRATMACPQDGRALAHLEDLIAGHGETLELESGFSEQLREFYEAVADHAFTTLLRE